MAKAVNIVKETFEPTNGVFHSVEHSIAVEYIPTQAELDAGVVKEGTVLASGVTATNRIDEHPADGVVKQANTGVDATAILHGDLFFPEGLTQGSGADQYRFNASAVIRGTVYTKEVEAVNGGTVASHTNLKPYIGFYGAHVA